MTEPWNLNPKTSSDTPEDRHAAAQTGALELAYIGDCVFELIVRTRLLQETGKKVKELHGAVVSYVCAAGQAALAQRIFDRLTEEERAVFLRGRNHRHIRIPKGSSPAEYAQATALEALLGYLYLCGDIDRIRALTAYAFPAADA